jgi:ketosteroid isomerase-like protein
MREDDETQVLAGVRTFYAAIEDMICGRGLASMDKAWHHTDWVTSKHPVSDWAVGWEEVKTVWEVVARFGRHDRGGSSLVNARVRLRGDMALVAVIFQAAPAWGSERLMCTDVLERIDGQWKLVHHHADAGPAMAAALESMLSEQ